MSSNLSRTRERALRKDLLRARAAVERQSLRKSACEVVSDISPAALIRTVMPRALSSGKGAGASLMQGARFLTRYPFLLSSLSSLLPGRGGSRSRLLKVGVGVFTVWQLVKMLKTGQGSTGSS
ncbi:MAG TPA: hypothetical protein DIS96_17475 [Pusillimonas sp.]|nr:hypothetical protein [Pusillimonas sp.]